MNKDRVAVFVDWANARILIEKEIKNASATLQNLHFSYNDIDKLTYLFASFIVPEEERLFRIYLYDAEAMSSSELYNYAEKAVGTELFSRLKSEWEKATGNSYPSSRSERQDMIHTRAQEFHRKIMRHNLYALRLGEQRCRIDNAAKGEVSFFQKQVDMLLGIDIAHVSLLKQVEKVMVFSTDTDIAPALNIARLNGIQTIVSHLNKSFHPDMRIQKHCDFVRSLDFIDIYNDGESNGWDFRKISRTEQEFD
ncbi:MAG: hypothetical protein IJG65_04475 [Synergistaceae bacterium]|nr:hypothetical protein [Synergistaceae bacterium]